MINLIPPKGYKTVKYEYYIRVASVIGLLFASVFVLLAVALIPTYVLLDAQIKTFGIEQGAEDKGADVLGLADYEVTITNEMIAQLKRSPSTSQPSEVIAEVRSVATPSIILNNFILNSTNGVVDSIQVQGQAPTREALANLKVALEASSLFGTVELPIADLARDENLPFAISIGLAQP